MSAAQYVARLTMCRCGHQAIEHYDSYLFCTWTAEDKCECEEFVAAGPEVHVQVGQALPSGEKQPQREAFRRMRACVEAWPECEEGKYDPRCCRFPKSCSCTVYDAGLVSESELEPLPSGEKQPHELHVNEAQR